MELWSLMHFLMPQVFSSHAQFKVCTCICSWHVTDLLINFSR